MTRWLLRLLVLAGLGFVAWKVWQLLQEDEDHSAEWATAARQRWTGARPVEAKTAEAARVEAKTAEAARVEAKTAEAARVEAKTAEAARVEAKTMGGARPTGGAAPAAGTETWVKPVGSSCPPGYPVKAKTASKVFRVPGMFSYEESKPERCYCSEEAALADGFTRAKR